MPASKDQPRFGVSLGPVMKVSDFLAASRSPNAHRDDIGPWENMPDVSVEDIHKRLMEKMDQDRVSKPVYGPERPPVKEEGNTSTIPSGIHDDHACGNEAKSDDESSGTDNAGQNDAPGDGPGANGGHKSTPRPGYLNPTQKIFIYFDGGFECQNSGCKGFVTSDPVAISLHLAEVHDFYFIPAERSFNKKFTSNKESTSDVSPHMTAADIALKQTCIAELRAELGVYDLSRR